MWLVVVYLSDVWHLRGTKHYVKIGGCADISLVRSHFCFKDIVNQPVNRAVINVYY